VEIFPLNKLPINHPSGLYVNHCAGRRLKMWVHGFRDAGPCEAGVRTPLVDLFLQEASEGANREPRESQYIAVAPAPPP
jgi:hypothetical protein